MNDAQLIPMMIEHHQDGIALSRLVEERGASADVKSLAARIRQGQEKEIAEMRSLAGHVKAEAKPHGEHHEAMKHQSRETMQRLQALSGPELDRAFLDEMARHHQMSIAMLQEAKLQHAETRELAQSMLSNQKKEMDELRKHQATLSRS